MAERPQAGAAHTLASLTPCNASLARSTLRPEQHAQLLASVIGGGATLAPFSGGTTLAPFGAT